MFFFFIYVFVYSFMNLIFFFFFALLILLNSFVISLFYLNIFFFHIIVLSFFLFFFLNDSSFFFLPMFLLSFCNSFFYTGDTNLSVGQIHRIPRIIPSTHTHTHAHTHTYISIFTYLYRLISLMGKVFGNGLGNLGSIPGRVIPKTLKMVLDTSLLNIRQYKVRIKVKVEKSVERSSPSPTPRCSSNWKGSLLVAHDYGCQLYFLLVYRYIDI